MTLFATNACLHKRETFLPEYRDTVKRGEFCPINWEACRRSFISFLSSVVEPAPGERNVFSDEKTTIPFFISAVGYLKRG